MGCQEPQSHGCCKRPHSVRVYCFWRLDIISFPLVLFGDITLAALIFDGVSVAPARSTSMTEAGEYFCRNPDPLPPFKSETFRLLSDILKLHPGGCVRNEQCSQVSKLVVSDDIICKFELQIFYSSQPDM